MWGDGVGRGDSHVEAELAGLVTGWTWGERGNRGEPRPGRSPPGGEISRGRRRCEWGSGAV